jgi:hypothetical protein
MMNDLKSFILLIFCILSFYLKGQDIKTIFSNPPEEAKPWVFWYWFKGAVSKDGITADLEAMKEAGIGGAYLMTIQGPDNPPIYSPPAIQLTNEWWQLMKFVFSEAKRLNIKLGIHACDGFAVAGGPWISPELSMQKVVWTDTIISGKTYFNDSLPLPKSQENYYKDIAVFAIPLSYYQYFSTRNIIPEITTSIKNTDASFLVNTDKKHTFRSEDSCWIQYKFNKPFTCRSIKIYTNGNNYQSQRLIIQASNDGKIFTTITRLQPARHGWQDSDADNTYSIKTTTAKYFRFVYNNEGSEPGSEDLDAAKWRQSLKIAGIELSSMPCINQYEGKSGLVWRIGRYTTKEEVPDTLCIPLSKIINLTKNFNNGVLKWQAPEGQWLILRFGHTSTGHTNYIGGAAKGLECDKFNPYAAEIQFNNWFGRFFDSIDNETTAQVLKIFHVDSWEAGSQNWSPVFRNEFKKRRGYDIVDFLPVFAGIPIENIEFSERILQDVRKTISELVVDNFFGTMSRLASVKGCKFSAESVAPTFTSDGMLHYSKVDFPMGEFWYNSPTHDKPNDILDAVSAGHIYGKNIIQAEAFTTLRMDFSEHPGLLKNLGDKNFALGINRFVFHVFVHNPWPNKKPGMTLNNVGWYFQRDQTWWKYAKYYIDYITRCQTLLQQGNPVVDIAVFTGEEIPRRALTPDRLVSSLYGLFSESDIEHEQKRLENSGCPLHEKPKGIVNSANNYEPGFWCDPLNGYKYDCINKDVLINLVKVENNQLVLNGVRYNVLVIPKNYNINTDYVFMSSELASKIIELVKQGATVIFEKLPNKTFGFNKSVKYQDNELNKIFLEIYKIAPIIHNNNKIYKIGKGQIVEGPIHDNSLGFINIYKDFFAYDETGKKAEFIEWNHRKTNNYDIYFISNQKNEERIIYAWFPLNGNTPEIFYPLTGEIRKINPLQIKCKYYEICLKFYPNESYFVVFSNNDKIEKNDECNKISLFTVDTIKANWKIDFDSIYGGPSKSFFIDSLISLDEINIERIKYYSGTCVYSNNFIFNKLRYNNNKVYLNLGTVKDIAEVRLNGVLCGVAWTYPYFIDITDALTDGENILQIAVTNTWTNRLIGDYKLPQNNRITWTNTSIKFEEINLLKSGLLGPVVIQIEK